jgi:HD-like signal output (HDOD) protein/GGDEF domain-containing protein
MHGPASSPAAVAKFVQSARQLYSLPGVAMRVLDLMRNPTVDVSELQHCVESDPALVGKLLRVVNSSLFGLSKPVADLNQAIALLGIQRLKLLVLGFSLPTPTTSSIQPAVLERYWRHAMLKAVAARELAESLWKIPGDEAFVAGLLQDIGLLALVQDLGDSYVKFLHGVWSVGNEPREMETEVLGFDHVEVSAKLLEDWGLPASLLAAISAPHDPAKLAELDSSERVLPQILDLAELLTRFLLYRQARWLDELLDNGEVYLGLNVEQLQQILAQLENKTPQFAEALAMPWKDETQYVRLLHEARQRQTQAIQAVTPTDLLAPTRRPAELLRGLEADQSSALRKDVQRIESGPLRAQPRFEPAPAATQPGPREVLAIITGPILAERLSAVIASCRKSRTPVSLALVQLDNGDAIRTRYGADRMADLLSGVKSLVCDAVDGDYPAAAVAVSDMRLAVIFAGLDRQEAIVVGRQILDGVRRWSESGLERALSLSVSIGLASLPMAPRNFPAMEMVLAAERCLHGVQLSGGDGFKSIEIC